MPTHSDVEAFLAAYKRMVGRMEWVSRHGGGADVAEVPLEDHGLVIGDLIAVQLPGAPREWKFIVRIEGTQVLRWEYLSFGKIRRHRNPKPVPPGFDVRDRALVHEHPFVNGECGRYSRPIEGQTHVDRHEGAFLAFCAHANICPSGYVEPPTPQLQMLP